MINLTVKVQLTSATGLRPVTGTSNRYLMIVGFYNSAGGVLANANIPNLHSQEIVTNNPLLFDINVPINDETFSVSGVMVKVYNNSVSDCCVASAVNRTISNTKSGSGDPIPGPPQDPGSVIVTKSITSGAVQHLEHGNIQFTGTGANRTMTDISDTDLPDGFINWYIINKKIVKVAGMLTNYPWPSNVPLGIMKARMKIGVTSMNIWGNQSWQDPNAGAPFSYNCSVWFHNFFFEPESTGFDPDSKVVQWMDYLPNMISTDGKAWVMPIGQISTYTELMNKGVTHFTNYEIENIPNPADRQALRDAGKTYDEVPKTFTQLGIDAPDGTPDWVHAPGAPNYYPHIWNNDMFHTAPGATEPMTTSQGAAAGNAYNIQNAIIIFENSEQEHAVSAHWPFWGPYYANLTSRLQTRFGDKWRVAHNYFTGALNQYPEGDPSYNAKRSAYGDNPSRLGYATEAQSLAFLDAPLSDYPPSPILPGGNMPTVNSCCFPIYLNAPDLSDDIEYFMIYKCVLTHKCGKYIFVFMQSFYEWNPNNYQETEFPDGIMEKMVKLPHNPAQGINYGFLSRVFADGFIPFSPSAKTDGEFRFKREFWNSQILWFPTGATDPANNDTFPYWTIGSQNEAFPTSGFEDYIARGMYLYYQTFMQVHGGNDSFLDYRVQTDGVWGPWIIAQNPNIYDVVKAHYAKRGIMYCRHLPSSNKAAVFYMNPYGDEKLKTIEYRLFGQTYSIKAASTMVVAKLHTL